MPLIRLGWAVNDGLFLDLTFTQSCDRWTQLVGRGGGHLPGEKFVEQSDQFFGRALIREAGEAADISEQDAVTHAKSMAT